MATDQPPSTAQTPNPQPPPLPPKGRKRPLDGNVQIQNSKYFKMRQLLKDLRPHFYEVLRAPDFKNCKSAKEIREKVKLIVELYQMMSIGNLKHDPIKKTNTFPNGIAPGMTLPDQRQKFRSAEPTQTERFGPKPSENWSLHSGAAMAGKQQSGSVHVPGGFVVGGSAFGWNYITSGGTDPAYYGVTKDTFRRAQAKSGEQ